jgi:DNA-binding MarR family transcriptional regulator
MRLNVMNRNQRIARFTELSQEIAQHMHVERVTEWPEHELSMPQFKALVFMASGRQRMGDLARFLGISLSSATSLADRLQTKGLVTRDHDQQDRRVVTCELTDEGRRTVTEFWVVGQKRADDLTSHLTDEEFDLVLHAFELLAQSWTRSSESVSSEQSSESDAC